MTRRPLLAAAAAATVLGLPGTAQAILTSCTVAASGVAFGSVTGRTQVDVTGTITLTCQGFGILNGYRVDLSTGSSGVYTIRTMKSGALNLNYNLYTTTARSTVFGNGTGGSSSVNGNVDFTLGTNTDTVTVFARLPVQTPLPTPGSYSDTIMVTVTF